MIEPALLLLALLSCAHPPPSTDGSGMNDQATRGVSSPALAQLLSDHWEWTLRSSPEWATQLGDHRYDALLGDRSPRAVAARASELATFLTRARALVGTVAGPDQITLELLLEDLQSGVATSACHVERWSVGARDTPVSWANELAEGTALHTPDDAAHLLARYKALPTAVDQNLANLALGAKAGAYANSGAVLRALEMVDAELAKPTDAWMLVTRAKEATNDPRFAAHVQQVVDEDLRPAYQRWATFVRAELLPHARSDAHPGLASLPDGPACYAAQIRAQTTLDLSPVELHQRGLDELKQIHAEMLVIGEKRFGTTDLPGLFERLRADPALHFQTREEVEAFAADALARAKAKIPDYFGRLPQTGCDVRPVPDYAAPYTTIAYYQPPVPGEAPGYYYVNSWQPETRPRFEAAVLAFHESIPGHHLQIAIAQELGDLPAFRRHSGFNAYVEGWALYTERLAEEMGLYQDDLDRLGMLSFDTWRASRLVVDTGLHAFGWSRSQSEAFMRLNTPLADNNIVNEVDRYIGWPGQALSYKVGQHEILHLRAEAEASLGDRFSLPGFHDAVLSGGAVSLPVLRRRVAEWVASRAGPG